MQFADLIGKEVALIIPRINQTVFQTVIVHGVEGGGLWIESQSLLNEFMKKMGVATAPKTLVFFVPYHQMILGMSSIEKTALSEEAFGVESPDL